MITLYQVIFVVTAFGASLIAGNVFLKKPESRTKFDTIFGFLAVSIIVWSLGRFQLLVADTLPNARFWVYIIYTGSTLIYVLFLHTILVFLDLVDRRKPILLLFYILSAISFLFNAFDLATGSTFFIQDVVPKLRFQYYEVPGSYHVIHIFNSLIIPLYALFEMLRAWTQVSGEKRQQLKFIIFSSLLGFLGGNSILFLVYDIPVEPFLLVLVPFHLLTLTYAVTRHHLFDIKVIGTELVTFSIWIILLAEVFLSVDLRELIINVAVLSSTILLGIILIRSVNKEVRQRQYIEKLMKQRSEFLDVASHQLRTPVSVILGTISLFREGDPDKLSQDQRRHFIDNIFHKARKLANIVNDLLEASEMDTAEPFQLTREYLKPTDPRGVIQEVIKELSPKAEEKGLRIEFDSAGNIPLVRTDPERLEQALTNLIDNAVKYTKEGQVRVELSKKEDRIIIAVSDSGIGIPQADQPKIFEKFARAKNAAELYTDGSGLGLFIVKAIIEAHEGGKIWFESEENKGTTFYVSLPAYQGK